jgi:hypothetical protein
MKQLLVLIILFFPIVTIAQKKEKPAIKAAATITAADMKKHLYIIAGKEMEGRDTPSPGLEKAAVYIEEHFKSLGLTPGNKGSYRQYYPLYKDSMLSAAMKVNGTTLEMNKDFQPVTSNYTAEMFFSEIVFAGYGIHDGEKRDDYKDLDVAGKAVIIVDGGPSDYKPVMRGREPSTSPSAKQRAAMAKGAVALLVVSKDYPRKNFTTTSRWRVEGYRASMLPFTFTIAPGIAAMLMGEDGKDIFEKIKAGTLKSKSYSTTLDLAYSKQVKTTNVSNVIAILEGTDKKDEYVMLTAHYDHIGKTNDTTIYYGADDDGSGTTAILEMAQAFAEAKKAGKGPRRTIIFMTVSGEEKGLLGSRYYTNHPIFPLEKTTVDLNTDMIGRIGKEYLKDKDSTNYVYVIGDDKLSTDLTPITDEVNNLYTKIKLDRKYNDLKDPNMFYYRSDHFNFADKGVPVIFYFNGTHADYHRPTDTPDKINYPLMALRAQLIFHTAWKMANRNDMLKRDMKLEMPRGF